MRIGLIYHQFRAEAGGLEKYLHGFASHLAHDGHQLVLIGAGFDDPFSSIPNTEIQPVRCRGSKSNRMRQFAERAPETAGGLKLDTTLGFGRTYTQDLHRAGGGCHRVYSRFLPFQKRIRRKNKLELELENRLYTGGNTKHFIVNTALVGRQIQAEYGVSPERISVIHTPVDTARFRPVPDPGEKKAAICRNLDSDPERPALLFVSLSHRRKGLAALLEAWNDIEADLWIAGAPLRQSHRRLVKRRGIDDRVHYLGRNRDLAHLYQGADGFLHPTLYDACANTVLQSLASGLPCLVSSRDGASEFIRDGENGFLLGDPTDLSEVLAGIHRILKLNQGGRARMAEGARQTVLPLTWDSHLKSWYSAIADVLKPNPQTP